ncbi:MAG: alpha/beta fold hydrolase [Oscillospiraceae bacterium]|nr:alpha/beta fold hydrolase [Oscillospiraceae bacterium]
MKKLCGTFTSSSKLCEVHYYFYLPEKPKAAVMLSHGMCEYIERYEEFARFLCDSDIALCGCDHIGHGKSIACDDMLGYFGHTHGHIRMAQDLQRMKRIMEKKLPDIPHFLIGHSMGSFVARIYFARCADDRWNGAVFMGTAGPVPWLDALKSHLAALAQRKGEMWRYDWGLEFALGVFNLRTENYRTPNDWLSRDDKNVDRFRADPKCNFTFTVNGYRDLLDALILCNKRRVVESTRTDVPLLFLSGGMDPVGEYGYGVRRACKHYQKHGCEATLRIYREARHELLFELNKDEVYKDLLDYMIKRI